MLAMRAIRSCTLVITLLFVSPSTASLCLIFPSQVQITLSFPTTNLPQPSPSGTYGIQDEDFILDGHAMLHNFVSTLHELHRHIFAEYVSTIFVLLFAILL